MVQSRRNVWLTAWYDDTNLLLQLEEPETPLGTFERPIHLSPDWPPLSGFDFEIHKAKGDKEAIERVWKKYGI